ncbi:hypothetical protein PLICRDRAFT_479687 [Plicaturopsis crispa FD-325 SS-3]|nr:hypothetical protein PLICRDRAFT_479687 [Plicaturopsis crispa FD-325 SS-3]
MRCILDVRTITTKPRRSCARCMLYPLYNHLYPTCTILLCAIYSRLFRIDTCARISIYLTYSCSSTWHPVSKMTWTLKSCSM